MCAGLLFRALGPSECFGVKGFTAKWLLRVVGLPVILSAIVALIYLQQRLSKSVGPSKAAKAAQGQMFMVIFFVSGTVLLQFQSLNTRHRFQLTVRGCAQCYPTICIVSFAAFICRQLTEDTSVLEADDAIICEDPSHKALQGVSVGIIILIAFGMPVLFGLILWTAARNYQRNIAKPNEEIAKRMADELDVPLSTAEYVVRDVTIGQNYSFLMDACLLRSLALFNSYQFCSRPVWTAAQPFCCGTDTSRAICTGKHSTCCVSPARA